ncbi:hypothetical protein AB1Y20_020358 [Prymnesium parvum]|uniref:Uncharacterized protein n=1 Tax=Prymnesium parvum TaxID=97485 RepID=A0AB34JWQ2_PRYPA
MAELCKQRRPELRAVMHAYARFHRRVFAADTPCASRRVLLVRESFSDAVGVGQMHFGFLRWLALSLVLGRALVFSPCEAEDDPWRVRGAALFKDAQPFRCDAPHLDFAQFYGGEGGIDYRWTRERRATLRRCAVNETSVDMLSPEYPANADFPIKCSWEACTRAANPE